MSKRVLTVGTFDLFHSGHVALLKYCREYAGQDGQVLVGVNTDRFVATFKKQPIQSLSERKAVLESCRYVDAIIDNDSACLESLLLRIAPHYLVIGMDWAPPKDYMKQIGTTKQWLKAQGIELVFIPRSEESQSSTKIKQAILDKA